MSRPLRSIKRCDPDEIARLYEGKSDVKVKVLGNLTAAMQGIQGG